MAGADGAELRRDVAVPVPRGGSSRRVRASGSQPAAAGKKGAAVSPLVAHKVARLKTIVAERAAWAKSLAQVKRMQQGVVDAEHMLDGSWAEAGRSREQ